MALCKTIGIFVLAVVLAGGLAACKKEEGPAERAGKQLDKGMEKAGQEMEKAGEKVKEAVKDATK
ncbi:MAG: hypothetical protein ACREQK_19345 [Candidatus Binatia bacterium]